MKHKEMMSSMKLRLNELVQIESARPSQVPVNLKPSQEPDNLKISKEPENFLALLNSRNRIRAMTASHEPSFKMNFAGESKQIVRMALEETNRALIIPKLDADADDSIEKGE